MRFKVIKEANKRFIQTAMEVVLKFGGKKPMNNDCRI